MRGRRIITEFVCRCKIRSMPARYKPGQVAFLGCFFGCIDKLDTGAYPN